MTVPYRQGLVWAIQRDIGTSSARLHEAHEGGHGSVGGRAVGGVLVQRQVAHDARRIVLRLLQVVHPRRRTFCATQLPCSCPSQPAQIYNCLGPCQSVLNIAQTGRSALHSMDAIQHRGGYLDRMRRCTLLP